MNPQQIEQLRQKLVLQRQAINELEATLVEGCQTVELDQSKVGRLSRMDAMQSQQMALEAARRRKLQLVNIERALARVKKEEYGYCLECGEEIDFRRLQFSPASSHCIRCAE
ncbi:MAG: TraR/DksA family transcriptional regulator [Gammaproteobacteria bacterium]|nr:TraR/DksA family transcriptional regulator [Gammaproteobacteria bacterium]MBL7000704.1 TraR/DksA family transcriptional regulator [Gammaproteobacteria bacterium]